MGDENFWGLNFWGVNNFGVQIFGGSKFLPVKNFLGQNFTKFPSSEKFWGFGLMDLSDGLAITLVGRAASTKLLDLLRWSSLLSWWIMSTVIVVVASHLPFLVN